MNVTSIAHMIKEMDPRSELGLELLDESSLEGLKIISRGTAILLLLVYIAYLFFQVCRLLLSDALALEGRECIF